MQAERLERIRESWSVYATRCRAEKNAILERHKADLSYKIPLEDDYLHKFWGSVSILLSSPEEKVKALRKMADIHLESLTDKQLRRRRKRFDQKKRGRLKLKGAECFVCGQTRHLDRHHIIQIKHGGSNQPQNLIPLCIPCHSEIHPWMSE